MAEADVESGGRSVEAATAVALGALVDTELQRWQARCRIVEDPDHHGWAAPESAGLIEAVLASLFDADGSRLEPAARAWAHSTPSMPILVRRLGTLRELFAAEGLLAEKESAERLQRILDKVTTLATEAAMAELEDAALTDALTGAGNRRALAAAGRVALAASARTGAPLSLVIIDLDGLKALNDTHGHAAGDRALATMSDALRAALRDTDQLFRIGGDEFVVLLPLAPADAVAELMRRAEQCKAPSFSWGVASAPVDAADLDGLLQIADGRLYAARRAAGYYEGRGGLAALAAGAAVPGVPARRPARHHRPGPVGVVLAAAGSVAAVVALVLLLPGPQSPTPSPTGSIPAQQAPPPGPPGAPLRGSPPPAPGGVAGPSPTGQSGTGSSAPTVGSGTVPGSGSQTGGTSGTGGATGSTSTTSIPATTTTTAAGSGGTGLTLPPLISGPGLLGH